jgi:hypothetical protein
MILLISYAYDIKVYMISYDVMGFVPYYHESGCMISESHEIIYSMYDIILFMFISYDIRLWVQIHGAIIAKSSAHNVRYMMYTSIWTSQASVSNLVQRSVLISTADFVTTSCQVISSTGLLGYRSTQSQ